MSWVVFLMATLLASTQARYYISCPYPTINNGIARIKGKSESIRFNCKRDYMLYGAKYAHCVRGKWNVDIPVCIKAGCHWPRNLSNGRYLGAYKEALVKVDCTPGYSVSGPTTVFCNGLHWNGTFPICEPKLANPPMSCIFHGDYCGWSEDADDKDAVWKLTYGPEPSIGLEWNTLNRGQNFTRLYSPAYTQDMDHYSEACFSFNHRGANGTLLVFMLLEGMFSFIASYPPSKQWKTDFFSFTWQDVPFQIVFETAYGADVKIMDFKIISASECFPPTTTENDDFDDINQSFFTTEKIYETDLQYTSTPTPFLIYLESIEVAESTVMTTFVPQTTTLKKISVPTTSTTVPTSKTTIKRLKIEPKIATNSLQEAVTSLAKEEPHFTIKISTIVQISAGSAVLFLLSTAVLMFFVRRRRRYTNQQNMAEDSDVRYLTSDEILDFTVAKPSDDVL